MKDLLIKIAQALVDNPEKVEVNEIESTQTVVLELKVAKSDMGKSSANRAEQLMPSGLY